MIIALAELNRWQPRWCPDEDVSHGLLAGYSLHAGGCQSYMADGDACVAACKANASCAAVVVSSGAACPKPGSDEPHHLMPNMQALAGNYAAVHLPTAEACIKRCEGDSKCGSLVFRHAGSSAGGGSCGAVNMTCCYLLQDSDPRTIRHAGWDSWAKGGVPAASTCMGAPGVKPGPRNVCCKFVAQAALDTQSDLSVLVANTSSWARDGILTSTVQPWRDRTFVRRYFEPPTHSGADPYGWVWELKTAQTLRHRVTGRALSYSFTVAGNGTILGARRRHPDGKTSRTLRPLRQFRYDGWAPGPGGA